MSIDRSGPARRCRRRHGILRYATSPGSSSFADFLAAAAPDLLPRARPPASRRRTARRSSPRPTPTAWSWPATAARRRATSSRSRDIEKVFAADDYSLVGIAGVAGLAIEIVRLYQVELEHYEKIEGTAAHPRRQGQPAGHDDPRQPRAWPCRAWPSCRCSPATTSTQPDAADGRPDLQLRRHRRSLPRAALPLGRFGLAVRPRRAEEAVAPGADRAEARPRRRRVALRRRRRRLRHRRPRHHPRHLSRWS